MSPEWLEGIAEWIRLHPGLSGIVAFAIAFLEGLAIVGIVIPGILLLFTVGALVGLGVLEFGSIWAWTSAGAMIGDAVSFWLGYRYRESIRDLWPFSRFEHLLDRGTVFFRRHGLKSVVIGRFAGPVRPVMPVVAGMMGMDLRRYVPANIVAAILWAPAYLLPGVVFGASLELARTVALRLALLLVLVLAVVWFITLLVRMAYAYLAPRTASLLAYALRWSQEHPHLGRVTGGLVDPARPESGALAAFALFLTAASIGLVAFSIAIPVTAGPLAMDLATRELMAGLRSPWADPAMAVIAGLGNYRVLFPAVGLVLAWLVWRRRLFAAAHWLAAAAFGLALAALIGLILSLGRPAAGAEVTGEPLPLAHIGLAVAVYGFFAVLIARELPRRDRTWPYLVAALAVALVALSRLYFAAYWLSDMLVGILLGVCWVAALGIAYRTRIRRSFWTVPVATVFFLAVGAGVAVHAVTSAGTMVAAYTPRPEARRIAFEDWRARGLPVEAAHASQVNFELAGDPDALRRALEPAGWQPAEVADWSVWLKLMQPQPTARTLPLFPGGLGALGDAMTLQRARAPDSQAQDVLRLWPTSLALEDGTPLWLGWAGVYRVERVAWFFSYWKQAAGGGDTLAAVAGRLEENGYRLWRPDGRALQFTTSAADRGESD